MVVDYKPLRVAARIGLLILARIRTDALSNIERLPGYGFREAS